MSRTIKQALASAYQQLNQAKIKTAHLDAELILCFVLKKSKEFLYTYPKQEIKKPKNQEINTLIKKRTTNYPLAYLINQKEFFKLNFFVNKDVLIPRPETEALVSECLKQITNYPAKTITIADIGTGSGCIPVAIAHNLEKQSKASQRIKILATDISSKALKVATKNAKQHKVKSKITFLHGDLLEPLKNKKLNILIANLPYLDPNYKNLLKSADQKSLNFEPSLALYSDQKGLAHYHDFFEQINQLKFKPNLILIEFGPKQTTGIKKIIKKYLPKAKITILPNQLGALKIQLT